MLNSNPILPSIAIVTSNEKKLKSTQSFFKEKRINIATIIITENTPLELVTQKQYDVFLVELHLAQFDGIEICKFLFHQIELSVVLLKKHHIAFG